MLNDDINQLERFLNTGFNELLQLVVLFAFSGVILISSSPELSLVGMAPIPVILWGSVVYQRRIAPRYSRVREGVGGLASRLENNLAGIHVIKSFTAESFETERVRQASEAYRLANFHAIRLSAIYVPVIRMAIVAGFAGVLLVGSYWVLQGTGVLTVGELVLFAMMTERLLWPLTRLGTTLDEYGARPGERPPDVRPAGHPVRHRGAREPGAAAARPRRGRLRQCGVPLPQPPEHRAGARRRELPRRPRRDPGHRRPDRLGQVDPDQAAPALLRRERRRRAPRRPRRARASPWATCGATSPWSARTSTCSTEPSGRTSRISTRRRRWRKSSAPRSSPSSTTLSPACRTATTRWSASAG